MRQSLTLYLAAGILQLRVKHAHLVAAETGASAAAGRCEDNLRMVAALDFSASARKTDTSVAGNLDVPILTIVRGTCNTSRIASLVVTIVPTSAAWR